MSDLIKPALFLGGIAIGAGLGYTLARGSIQKKADAEVEASRAFYEKKYQDDLEKTTEDIEENTRIGQQVFEEHVKTKQYAVPDKDEFDDDPHWVEREKKKEEQRKAAPPIQIIRPESEEEDEPTSNYGYVQPPLDNEDVTMWPRDPREPYVITFEEFQTENAQWDKHTMHYYEYCNTLSDERESIVTDVDDCVGTNNLLHFGKGSGNADIVYIRNEFREVDIELIRDERSYQTAVMGIPNEEDVKEKIPRVKRKIRDDI